MRPHKFHGRYDNAARECHAPGCEEPGEFRAPGSRAPSSDGPGDWRWLCLDHVREFNTRYNYFSGMSSEVSAALSAAARTIENPFPLRRGPERGHRGEPVDVHREPGPLVVGGRRVLGDLRRIARRGRSGR